MSNNLEKITTLEENCFKVVKDYFDKYENGIFENQDCPLVYKSPFAEKKDEDIIRETKSFEIFRLNNSKLFNNFNTCVDYIKRHYSVKYLWMLTFPPKTKLGFTRNYDKQRFLLTFNSDPKMFIYSTETNDLHNKEYKYNLWINEMSVDDFNTKYLEDDDKNILENSEPLTIYDYGRKLTNFVNDSDKVSFNIVFEIME
jgi:hypothetical protein